MKQHIRFAFIILFLFVLVQCGKAPETKRYVIITVTDPVVTITEGTQVDWTGVFTATDESGTDLTGLVSMSPSDTTGFEIGIHEVVLRLVKDDLWSERIVSVNVILTDEDVVFDVPDTLFVFEKGGTVSAEDFEVTARTTSGTDLTDRIEILGYNLDSLQTGFHTVTFRIKKTATSYEEVEVPFEVRDGENRIEILDILENVNIRHYEVHGNLVYMIGFHWEDEDVYDDFIVFDMEDGSVTSIVKWAGNLHGTPPWPQDSWSSFTVHEGMIHIVGARVDMVDETAEGTDKFSYQTMVDVYHLNLTKSHSYVLEGAAYDMPESIAINASGEIAITGYGIRRGSSDQTALYGADHALIKTYNGDMKAVVAIDDAFVAAGGTYGYTSEYVDGYAFMFDSEGMIWQHTERGFDYDYFTHIEKTGEGLVLFGETDSHQYPDVHNITFIVRMDLSGNVLGRVYYPEASFASSSFARMTQGTWMVTFDTVRYPCEWNSDGWAEQRIPKAILYDSEGNLLESHTVYIEKYVTFERSIVLAYGESLYVIASLGYQGVDLDDVGDPSVGLFIVRIHRGN